MCNIEVNSLVPSGGEGDDSDEPFQGNNDNDNVDDNDAESSGDGDEDDNNEDHNLYGSEDNNSNSIEEDADDSDNDSDLLRAIKSVRMRTNRQSPPPINCEELVVDLSFHPNSNVLAAATISGDLLLYKYDSNDVTLSDSLEVHTKACRAVEYSENGDLLFSASKDRSIMISDSRTGKLKEFYDKAHEGALYCLTVVSEHIFATGDEDGVVKIWDIRHREPIFTLTNQIKDYVSGMVTTGSKRYLACSSGEGTITTINIPARKFHVQSEVFESEYTCVGLCLDNRKLVAGTASGKLVFYNWGEFGLHSDEFPNSCKKAINCQVTISDNIIITGCEDGQIRATYLFPNKNFGVVGQHELSVDALDISHDGEYIASCSLDQKIHFWPISYFNDFDYSTMVTSEKTNLPSSQYTDRGTFFADLE